ncbi:glycoside hydrolase [Gaertneriomyces semiglobifer]|nr:glycoside hydrolase [Gaertneriomyces semiglobifer]
MKRSVFRLPIRLYGLAVAWLLLLTQHETTADTHGLSSIAAANESLFWGTYRPNLFFGTRTRSSETLLTGLMWLGPGGISTSLQNIRHTCEQSSDLSGYAWLKHDGRRYGNQTVRDASVGVTIGTEYIKRPGGKHGGDWAVRVTGTSLAGGGNDFSLVFYTALDGNGKLELQERRADEDPVLCGNTEELGDFCFAIVEAISNRSPTPENPLPEIFPDLNQLHTATAKLPQENIWRAKEALQEILTTQARSRYRHVKRLEEEGKGNAISHLGQLLTIAENAPTKDPNMVFFQKWFTVPFEVDIVFLSASARTHYTKPRTQDVQEFSREALSLAFSKASQELDTKFERKYGLHAKGFDQDHIAFGQTLLGNMVGGLGYFHGTSIVDRSTDLSADAASVTDDDYFDDDDDDDDPTAAPLGPVEEGPTSLFTAVPSRPFFPRGFFWDEGFHQLLIGTWDNDLSLDIINHWIDLIDDNGWVAREQILGPEARSKVPEKFQTQYTQYGNPPTLVMALNAFMERFNQASRSVPDLDIQPMQIVSGDDTQLLSDMHLNNPQMADEFLKKAYRKFRLQYEWFRRTQSGEVEAGGRKTMGCEGFRWRGREEIHTLTSGLDDYPRAPSPHLGELHLDLLSWMAFYARTLKSIASHLDLTDDVQVFEQDEKNMLQSLEELHWSEADQCYTDLSVDDSGKSVHIVHKGYISLFPLALGLVDPSSPRLGAILDLIHNPEELWTPYGIRSLSKQDPYFGTGENYWRGPIWMNINYLVLSSLKKVYASQPGPYREKAEQIYRQLRHNVIENVYKEYERTGYVWEQYAQDDGRGLRSHPFTGWTSLVLLIMSEIYP